MPPPPSTPSPRRFIAGRQDKATPKPPSSLRFQTVATPNAQSFSRPSPSQQFAATPRFSFAQPKSHDVPLRTPPRPKPAIAHPTPGYGIEEAIEDASQEKPAEIHDEDEDEDEDEMMMQTTEVAEEESEDFYDWPPSPKRQRLLLPDHTTPRRFVFAPPSASPSIATPTQHPEQASTHSARPHFIKPASAPPDVTEPLPEAFSPHRRGQKFVPGGMAAEARQWIFDAAQPVANTHARRMADSGADTWRVRVMESRGDAKDGMILVRGSVEGKEVKLLLPSAGKNKTLGHVAQGVLLGIKAPSWEVEILRQTWVVAVDWRVVKD